MGWIVKMNGKGRISIPAEVRNRIGLKRGDDLKVDLRDEEIIVTKLTEPAPTVGSKDRLKGFLRGQT